jgi:hypothetical protein
MNIKHVIYQEEVNSTKLFGGITHGRVTRGRVLLAELL